MEKPQTAESPQDMIELAQRAVQIAKDDYGIALDFSPESLASLYKLLDRAHILKTSPAYENVIPNRTILIWGAYLGETIRLSQSGEWKENPAANYLRRYCITAPTGNFFPMEQIYLRVVPGIQTNNLKAAIKEPPTIKISPDRGFFLVFATAGVLIVIAGMVWLFVK